MSWERKKFIDFILLQRGYDLTQKQIIKGNYPVVTSTSILGYHNAYKANGPGVITGRSGTIGKVLYIESNYWPHNTSLYVKDFKGNDPKFVYYFMRNFGTARAKGGSAVPTLNKNNLSDIDILVPTLDLQKKIVNLLLPYDKLIENNQKQIKLLEEAAQRLYKEWFVDLRFPGYEDVKIVDGVPEGWELKPLSNIFKYVRGKSYTSKEIVELGGTLMVNLKNIKPFGSYNRNVEKRFDGNYKDSQKLNAGDLIMGVTDMTQERRLVGHIAIVPDMGETMTFSMDLIKLVPLSVKKSFIYATMYFGGYSKKISPLANGVNVLHLKPEAMMNMKMLIPTEEVIEQYDKIFEVYQKQIEVLQKQCDFATEARDRLLPKLMSGEIEI